MWKRKIQITCGCFSNFKIHFMQPNIQIDVKLHPCLQPFLCRLCVWNSPFEGKWRGGSSLCRAGKDRGTSLGLCTILSKVDNHLILGGAHILPGEIIDFQLRLGWKINFHVFQRNIIFIFKIFNQNVQKYYKIINIKTKFKKKYFQPQQNFEKPKKNN